MSRISECSLQSLRFYFAILCSICLAASSSAESLNGLQETSKFVQTDSDKVVEAGINLGTEAYEAVCWYEFLKNYLPRSRSLDFNQCHGQANFQRKIIFKHGAHERYFGQFLMDHGMQKLPHEYMKCSSYLLQDRYSKLSRDYTKIFKDSNGFTFYKAATEVGKVPYEAFAHCLIAIVQEKYGDVALEQISEKLAERKGWAETMFERENEFRALHGVPALKINDELTFRAQKWANQLARSCQMYHIHSSHRDYLLNGSRMGENLFTGDSIESPKEDMALFGTNIWYEEIEYYPWPEYKDYGSDPFHQFSHFSQMIWKNSKMVGYGFAANETCGQYFIVSRYFPPGNFWGEFGENVLPLKKKKRSSVFAGATTTLAGGDEKGTTTVFTTSRN